MTGLKKIMLSLGMVVVVGAVVASGTGAFFSDTETSTGNTFTAGAIDLTVDNHAWYNGIECKWYERVGPNQNQPEGWYWAGSSSDSYMQSLIGTPCTSSWEADELAGKLFFNFSDLKPGDWEEDTISLHVNNNDAYMCANLKLTMNSDVDCTEPELSQDALCAPDNAWNGDLASELNFIFWADDGDNVLESDESIVLRGDAADLPQGDGNPGQTFPIADSQSSIFGGPIKGGEKVFIGKAFCFGALDPQPVQVSGPTDTTVNNPALDPGFDCSGVLVNNASQTDKVMGDMAFYAVQSRNNPGFVCSPSLFGAQ
jgi:predicted ribosomally synthesized peptide with SipW-like signal peptide